MKRFSNILVALGVTMLLLTVGMKSEAVAQSCCPSGSYTQTSVTSINPTSGCTFTINYCYYIEPSGVRNIFICSISVPTGQPNPPCDYSIFVLDEDFWILVDTVTIRGLHSINPFVPCNEEGGGPSNVIVETTKAKCQRSYLDYTSGNYVIEACDEEPGECQNTYAVCMLNGEFIKTHIAGPTQTGSGSCPKLNPDLDTNSGACTSTCD
ncbi:MAG: hypothetical protein R2863_00655 [Candidatus Kapaibacterium sp.]|nr:hypothetical protein [Ignavibacteriota bacterium]MCB9220257.1 hypothetical protein [Ignavibacteria bacterium]